MKKNSRREAKSFHPSKTAEAAAAVRAVHALHEQSIIFDDPFAVLLTSPGWRFLAQSRLFYQIGVRKFLKVLRPVHGQVLARSRYTEERLEAAVAAGISQYVILGAGLDSFALRRNDLMPKLSVFEIDHPGTQQLKQDRISALGKETPHNLAYVAVDFEGETMTHALANTNFDHDQPAFFSWLGTIPYLTQDAVFKTLKALSSMKSGSELVFDYADAQIAPEERLAVEKLKQFTARRGEDLITQFAVDTLCVALEALGFDVVEDISHGKWRPHYYQDPLLSTLRPLKVARIAHVTVQ